jgi:hypothetical protein
MHRDDMPTHLTLEPGETGLNERMIAKAEDITTVRRGSLNPPRTRLRNLSDRQIQKLASMVVIAMGCTPHD